MSSIFSEVEAIIIMVLVLTCVTSGDLLLARLQAITLGPVCDKIDVPLLCLPLS